MPVYNTFNYGRIVVRTFHATPTTVVVRSMPPIHNSTQRFPTAAQVESGIVFGPGQYDHVGYETGTLVAGGGSAVYRVIGSAVVRRLVR